MREKQLDFLNDVLKTEKISKRKNSFLKDVFEDFLSREDKKLLIVLTASSTASMIEKAAAIANSDELTEVIKLDSEFVWVGTVYNNLNDLKFEFEKSKRLITLTHQANKKHTIILSKDSIKA